MTLLSVRITKNSAFFKVALFAAESDQSTPMADSGTKLETLSTFISNEIIDLKSNCLLGL